MDTKLTYKTKCRVCQKDMLVSCEEFVDCVVCDDCPFPRDPCETCNKPDCDGECCNCEYCIKRRSDELYNQALKDGLITGED